MGSSVLEFCHNISLDDVQHFQNQSVLIVGKVTRDFFYFIFSNFRGLDSRSLTFTSAGLVCKIFDCRILASSEFPRLLVF
jgi:hypothetical protein